MAAETQALAGWIERRLAEETSTATSYVLPLPESREGSDGLIADIKKGAGRLHIVDTTAAAWGDGTASAPRQDWVRSAWERSRRTLSASSATPFVMTCSAPTASPTPYSAPGAQLVRLTGSS